MRRLIADVLRAAALAARRTVLRIRYGLADRELQLLDTHAARMRAERAALCEERGRIALELLTLEAGR
jgi:hypothetical protein